MDRDEIEKEENCREDELFRDIDSLKARNARCRALKFLRAWKEAQRARPEDEGRRSANRGSGACPVPKWSKTRILQGHWSPATRARWHFPGCRRRVAQRKSF